MSKSNPSHYQQGSIEIWDFIIDQELGYLSGNIIKYIARAGRKESETRLDDLLKAQAYIHKLVLTEIDQIHGSSRPSKSSNQIQESNGATDCYDGYEDPYDATVFDR